MITVLLIIGIICFVLGIIFVCLDIHGLDFFWGVVGSYIISGVIMYNNISRELSQEPTAMDVYQGKTELKIISVNGIPIDTVVVYKNKH